MNEENKLIQERRSKLSQWRQQGAYPNSFKRDSLAHNLQQQLGEFDKAELEQRDQQAKVAGRIMAKRGPFMVLQDVSGQIQLYVDRKNLPAELLSQIKSWDIGDIVGAEGPVHKSGKGDLYVYIQNAQLLSKSLRPLPEKYHGISDIEQRYRQRYVDLIMSEDTRQIFRIRSACIDHIRQFFVEHDFLEVETPMMHPIPGGAAARPFVTHHNTLDMQLYLRIAPELYLKRLVVGGFERVFEINRNFRNEGLSTRHNPEFTMLEFYWAYADYQDLMTLTENLLRSLVTRLFNQTTLDYQGQSIDFSIPFACMSLQEAVLKYNPELSSEQLNKLETARAIAEKLPIKLPPDAGLGRIQTEIFEATVEHQLHNPTFITQYPTEVSPLSRCNDDNSAIADRFELFIAGREIANGFSELNDPEDQTQRFQAQVQAKDAGDVEAMHFDHDYIRALEYGLPPTAGEGIGIDRLVMLLTDSASIRDVILFPLLRPEV